MLVEPVIGAKRPFEHGSDSDAVSVASAASATSQTERSDRSKRVSDASAKTKALSWSNVTDVCATVCGCMLGCSKYILAPQLVRSLIAKTFSYAPKERGNIIFHELESFAVDDGDFGRTLNYKVNHRPCCAVVWQIANGYSRHQVNQARRRVLNKKATLRTPTRLRKKKLKPNSSGSAEIEAGAWLLTLAHSLGDKMPTFNQIRIPFHSNRDVHREYVEDMKKRHGCHKKTVTEQTFGRIWSGNKRLQKVILTPANSSFAECDECASYRRKLEQSNLSTAVREGVKAARKAHLDLQRGERLAYANHRELSHREPLKYACIILDGMELRKSTLPHMKRESKATDSVLMNTRFVQRLIGAKLHHNGETKHFGFVIPPWVGGGSANAICEVIMRIIDAMGDSRPPTLFIQVDNCSENKCKTVLALAHMLISQGILHNVQFNYLVVGHTHEDIDQWFSIFSTKVKKHDVWTPRELMHLLTTMSEDATVVPKVVFVTSRHNFVSWLADSIDPQLGYYGRLLAPHEFWFGKVNGEVVMRYKAWAQSETTLPTECSGIKVVISLPALPAPVYDEFDQLWDEDEKVYAAVCAVVDVACHIAGVREEWAEYWANIPQKVEDVVSKWSFASVKPLQQADVPVTGPDVPQEIQAFRDSQVLVSHAGLPRTERNRVVRDLSRAQQLRLEADHAKTLRPLEKNEFVAFVVDADFWDQPGFSVKERELRLCVGKLPFPVETINPDDNVQVLLMRCPSGDINGGWVSAVREGSRTASRVIGIPRGSIIYHGFNFFSKNKHLSAVMKKDMGSYFMCPYFCPKKNATLVLRTDI